jgi:hypothetical protein
VRRDKSALFQCRSARPSDASSRASCCAPSLPLRDEELQASLVRLVASELVFQRGPSEAVYSFKHTLVQDAAHRSLPRSARQQLHAIEMV